MSRAGLERGRRGSAIAPEEPVRGAWRGRVEIVVGERGAELVLRRQRDRFGSQRGAPAVPAVANLVPIVGLAHVLAFGVLGTQEEIVKESKTFRAEPPVGEAHEVT